MIIDKEKGFLSTKLNETLGIMSVEVVGTGRNNNTIGYVKVGEQSSRIVNGRGLSVFLYNDDFTFNSVRRFDTYTNGDVNKNAMSSYLKQLPSNKYIFIVSFDSHDTNPQLMNTMLNMGAVRYSQIPFNGEYDNIDGYVYNRRTPYCAIGTTDIGIVYESLGSPKRSALYPNAELNVVLPDIQYVGVQGYGENVLPFSTATMNLNDKFINYTVRNQLGMSSQCYKISFTGYVTDQVNSGNRGFWVRVDKVHNVSGNIIDTLYTQYVTSSTPKKHWGILDACSQNQTYRITIVNDSNSECNLTNIEVRKSSKSNPLDENLISRIKDDYISALTLRNSSFGMEPFYADELKSTYDASGKLFSTSLTGHIYDYFELQGITVSSQRTSAIIDLNGTPSGYAMNCIVKSSSGCLPSIDVEFLDDNNSSISRTNIVEFTSSIPTNTPYLIEHFSFYNSVNNINYYNEFQNIRYGYKVSPSTNIASTIPSNASKIRYYFNRNGGSNYDVIFPCVNSITPKISNNLYISPTFFNNDVRSKVLPRPDVTLSLGDDLYESDGGITEELVIGDNYTIGQVPPIINVNNDRFFTDEELVIGMNAFYDPDFLRQETTLSWSVSGFNVTNTKIYKNGFFIIQLPNSTTSWSENRLVSYDTYYQVYFLINGIHCLREIFIPKR